MPTPKKESSEARQTNSQTERQTDKQTDRQKNTADNEDSEPEGESQVSRDSARAHRDFKCKSIVQNENSPPAKAKIFLWSNNSTQITPQPIRRAAKPPVRPTFLFSLVRPTRRHPVQSAARCHSGSAQPFAGSGVSLRGPHRRVPWCNCRRW